MRISKYNGADPNSPRSTGAEANPGSARSTRRELVRSFAAVAGGALATSAGCVGGVSQDGRTTTSGGTGTAEDAPSTSGTADAGSRTVTDATGRTVALPEAVEDVVAVGPGALNLVAYLDAVDMVVGVEENEHSWGRNNPYNIANPGLRDKPVIGPHKGGDPELIADADPDVVVGTYMTAGTARDLHATIERPVVVLKAEGRPLHQLEKFYGDLRFAGRVLDRSERAEAVVDFVRSEITALQERAGTVSEAERDRVFLAGRSDSGGAGVTSTQHPFAPFAFVDAQNVASSVSGHATVSRETLLTWNPAVIFISESNLDRVAEALAGPSYADVAAIESGDIYGLLPSRFYGNLYGSVLADAYFVGSVLYPDAFGGVDPAGEADRLYDRLLGAPVYDELADRFGGFMRVELG